MELSGSAAPDGRPTEAGSAGGPAAHLGRRPRTADARLGPLPRVDPRSSRPGPVAAGRVGRTIPREATLGRRLRPIAPSTHRGQQFGIQLDVQHVVTDAQRGQVARYLSKYLAKACDGGSSDVGAPMAAHLHALSRAVRAQRQSEGRLCTHDGHQRPPTALVARCAKWRWHHCFSTRRALRQGGHGGRTFGRSRSWPVSLADLRARRTAFTAGDQAADDGVDVAWVYVGRGYEAPTSTGPQRDRLIAAALGDAAAAALAPTAFITPDEIVSAQAVLAL